MLHSASFLPHSVAGLSENPGRDGRHTGVSTMKNQKKKASSSSRPAKKPAPKPAAKKPVAKKAPAKKPAAKKTPAKKPVAKKAPAKKPAAKKAPAKKPAAKKAPAKKPAPKPVAKKTPAKKPVAKKVVQKKPAPKPIQKKPVQKKDAKKTSAPKPVQKKDEKKKQPAPKPVEKKDKKKSPPPAPKPVETVVEPPAATEPREDVVPIAETWDRKTSFVSTLPPEIEPAVPSVDDDGDLFGDEPAPVGDEPANFSKKELAALRTAMVAERNRLLGKAASLQAQSLTRADEVNPEEDGTDAIMRITEMSKAEGAEGLVNQIDAALRAIDAGTYGTCQACGGKIRKARLKAYPFATLCVKCQHEAEAEASLRSAAQPADYGF